MAPAGTQRRRPRHGTTPRWRADIPVDWLSTIYPGVRIFIAGDTMLTDRFVSASTDDPVGTRGFHQRWESRKPEPRSFASDPIGADGLPRVEEYRDEKWLHVTVRDDGEWLRRWLQDWTAFRSRERSPGATDMTPARPWPSRHTAGQQGPGAFNRSLTNDRGAADPGVPTAENLQTVETCARVVRERNARIAKLLRALVRGRVPPGLGEIHALRIELDELREEYDALGLALFGSLPEPVDESARPSPATYGGYTFPRRVLPRG